MQTAGAYQLVSDRCVACWSLTLIKLVMLPIKLVSMLSMLLLLLLLLMALTLAMLLLSWPCHPRLQQPTAVKRRTTLMMTRGWGGLLLIGFVWSGVSPPWQGFAQGDVACGGHSDQTGEQTPWCSRPKCT